MRETLIRERWIGVCPAARGAVLAGLVRTQTAPVWVVVAEDRHAAELLAEDTALFLTPAVGDVVLLPEAMPDSPNLHEAFTASSDRLAVLSRLRARRRIPRDGTPKGEAPLLVFTTPAALLQPVPALEEFARREFTVRRGERHSFHGLLERLAELDYDSEVVCEAPGQYAVRGGIVDVYPVAAARPYRLDFFGDEIESLRAFDPVTQRSGDTVDAVTLSAAPGVRLQPSPTGLAEYLSPATRLVLVEPAALEEEFRTFAEEENGFLSALRERCASLHAFGELDEPSDLFGNEDPRTLDTESLQHHRSYPGEALVAQERLQAEEEARRRFLRQLADWQRDGYGLLLVAPREGEERRLQEILATEPRLRSAQAGFVRGMLNEGFRLTLRGGGPEAGFWPSATGTAGLVVITETEIFGRQRGRRPVLNVRAVAQRHQVDQLLDFSELVEGDFVVHLQHGIALYRGITRLDTAQGPREVVSLEFDDHVTLHVPLQESHLISRYVGLSRARPQLGRIGSGRWEKSRHAAERATVDLAAELLRLQAQREAQPGHAFGPDTAWQKEFEAAFPHVETPDQLRAIAESKTDMERARPMDRLICGDVGFGKTEVALRAAFKAVQDGFQVAILVPTTVLAQQHLNTFRERMAGYPVAIEMANRFRTRAELQRILDATAQGQVDVLIGTHRLLQRDVRFRNLGLVVIDEEHRFGVRHKETLKRLRTSVDVLSMSATPIPRTLHLALTGARDMSVIETAPANRHPIQTLVRTYDDQLVVDAIRHEIRRGGQVFYLHNRVATIETVARHLRQLLPDLDIAVGHGQMSPAALERRMTDFVAGRHQVLVCTTIIESGLDLPNCNTLIIEGADRFGLAQLYQLRGRIGRFKHQAYAYLLLHRHTRLVEVARQRLGALRAHNQLGAGFRIALRDLELRGAGNLLGAEQSGHIASVGFELYCQLLRQSIARLKGDRRTAAARATVKLDFVHAGPVPPGGGDRRPYADAYTALRDAEREAAGVVAVAPIEAHLPSSYIGEARLRIDIYRRLALASDLQELRNVEADLRDRFGKFGDEVRALLLLTKIRILAEQKGLVSVESEASLLKCLRQGGQRDDWVQPDKRFPRLTAPRPLLRLREIIAFLDHLP